MEIVMEYRVLVFAMQPIDYIYKKYSPRTKAGTLIIFARNLFPADSSDIKAQGISVRIPISQDPAVTSVFIYVVQMMCRAMSVAVNNLRVVMFA